MTAIGAIAQTQTLTVNDGDETNQSIPLSGYYAGDFQYNQMLYPAADISAMNGMEITEMVFYFDENYGDEFSMVENGGLGSWIISLVETDATSLTDLGDIPPTTQVYEGTLVWDHTAQTMTITFNEPYVYNGGNLLVDVIHINSANYNDYFFIGVETEDYMSYNWFLDEAYNFLPKTTFSYQPAPTCPKPKDLIATHSSTTVTVSWTAGGTESTWNLRYMSANESDWTVINDITNPYTIEGLAVETDYEIQVQASCAENDLSRWSSSVSLYTGYCTPEPMSVDRQGIIGVSFGLGENVVNNLNQYGLPDEAPYYGNYTNLVGAVMPGLEATVDITYSTGFTYGTIIWIDLDNSFTFDADEVVYVGMASAEMPTTLSASFTLPMSTPSGDYRMRIAGADDFYDDYIGSISAAANADPCPISYYTVVNDYTIRVLELPSCLWPTNLLVSDIGPNSVSISWEDENSTAWQYKLNDGEIIDTEVNTLNITSLRGSTVYTIDVRANCGNGDYSYWSSTTFKTLCSEVTIDAENPYTEDFESYVGSDFDDADGVVPDCWESYNTYSEVAPHVLDDSYEAHSGTNSLTFYGYGNCYAVLPEIVNDFNTLHVSFWSQMESVNYAGTLTLGYITAEDNNMDSFTPIDSYPSTYEMTQHSTLLRTHNIPAEATRLVFRYYNSSNWRCSIDDIVIRLAYPDAQIVDFNFPTRMSEPEIIPTTGSVNVVASYQADLTNLAETVTVSEGATYVETSSDITENERTFHYVVTSENGIYTSNWTVVVTKATTASTANDIVSFTFDGQSRVSDIDTENHAVIAYAEWDFDIENEDITPTIGVSPMATINPASGVARNFYEPVQYTVTAEDETSVQEWTVTIVNDPNACVNPFAIDVDDIEATTATLTWNKVYTETSYRVKVSSTEMSDMNAEADAYDNVVVLEGDETVATLAIVELEPITTYYVYVQSNCGAEDWTETSFTTQCAGAVSVPFVENFNNNSATRQCWTIIDANNDAGYQWNLYMGGWYYENGFAEYYHNPSNQAEDWLISPRIAVVDGAYLTFKYRTNTNTNETFSVYIMDSPADYENATIIRESQTVCSFGYSNIENIDLSAYAGEEKYIGIKCESDAGAYALYIDDFTVELPTYTIVASAGENGIINPEGSMVVYHGASLTFIITPEIGYRIASVIIDEETENAVNVTESIIAGDGVSFYTFENVNANHTINATFELIPTYTITVNAGENGNVYYNDALVSAPIVVTEGATPQFEITPETGYQIDALTVGENTIELTEQQMDGFTYTFEPVMSDITLTVTFEAIPATTYTIIATAGVGGTITPAEATVEESGNAEFTISANDGYRIASVIVDAETENEANVTEQLIEGVYTFENVTANHTIAAAFEALPQPTTYTITLTVGEHGTVTPSGENGIVTVNEGDDITFTITPDEGYLIGGLIVDETPVYCDVEGDVVNIYGVNANHTIDVMFTEIPVTTYTIQVIIRGNGSVTYIGEELEDYEIVTVAEGATPEFTIIPAEGYMLAGITIGEEGADVVYDEDVDDENVYTFDAVTANWVMFVTFVPNTYTITLNVGEHGTVIPTGNNGIAIVDGVITVNHGDDLYFEIIPDENYKIETLAVNEVEYDLDEEEVLGFTLPMLGITEDMTFSVTFTRLNVAEMIENGSMVVYPNPNNGKFSIDFSNINGNATYQLLDIRGAVVETRDINVMNGATMNFNYNLTAGTYFVRIISGDKVYVEQIVVE